MTVQLLLERQNPDGGWPYVRGASWTEPTSYAVLALLTAGEQAASSRGLGWLRDTQRPDGGWAPQSVVGRSSWVTALPAFLPPESIGVEAHRRAIAWLANASGAETSFAYRMREWLLGVSVSKDQANAGWPWMPGAAAWVGPTSLAILALEKEMRRRHSIPLQQRIDTGRRFLLSRVCEEGGWNYGCSQALGYASRPYPETTGMALAALRGVDSPLLENSIGRAGRFLAECRSADGLNWLRIGLGAHGRMPAGFDRPPGLACRNLSEVSLSLLAGTASTETSVFWC
jgi:squalene cyclase